ncbi:MAG: hypothetical protein AAF846_29505 [Chloroflexota bacterium]
MISEQQAENLLTRPESELRLLLANSLSAIQAEPSLGKTESVFDEGFQGALERGGRETPSNLMSNIADTIIQSSIDFTYQLICSSDDEMKNTRTQVLDAINVKNATVVVLISQYLIGVGFSHAVAAVIAAIVVQYLSKIVKDGSKPLCEHFKTYTSYAEPDGQAT